MAHREKELLRKALASMSFADEVVAVIDPRGDPECQRIAGESGARVVLHEYAGDIEQKRFAVEQTTHEWVLYLDADEEVSEELVAEIRELLSGPEPSCAGYELNRLTWHLGRWIRHGDFNRTA